jgi:hypothetical protein
MKLTEQGGKNIKKLRAMEAGIKAWEALGEDDQLFCDESTIAIGEAPMTKSLPLSPPSVRWE